MPSGDIGKIRAGKIPVAPDTIAAVATAAGRGGIGVVRVSGPKVPAIAKAVIGLLP